jgi:Tol biopolymer transport system component
MPPNIAPLNFSVQERGCRYLVKVHARRGRAIQVLSESPKILIPQDAWHELLDMNRGQQLHFDVFVQTEDGRWRQFQTITNSIASEDIDSYIVYRKIRPGHTAWRKMGIYQRNLNGFDTSLVLDNDYFAQGCLNCHTFCNNRTDKMLIHTRSAQYGSSAILVENGQANKIGTKFGYTSWHPSGKVAAYSVNMVTQFFHSARDEVRDVIDLDSYLAYYLVDLQAIKTTPDLARKDRLETYPTWSPDGRYLYFCSAPLSWTARDVIPSSYDKVKYDLVRVQYDLDRDQWGQPETVLSARETGMSILLPRISPDGRWLVFCMCNYGCFPVYQQSSDLYMIDLEAARQSGRYEYRRLKCNSDNSESWHSWSSNGRWMAFSSKRQSGVFTRLYLSYVDENGRVHKPILLPQKDPAYYDSCLWTYSVPELVVEPVTLTKEKLGRVVRGASQIPVQVPITMATPKAEGLPPHDEPWRESRR